MNQRTLAALLAVAALAVTAACGGDSNTNANRANTNAANRAATPTATPTPANTNRAVNANITRDEYNREQARYDDDARRSGRTIGSGINDRWLWTKVRAQLLGADDLRESTINVDVENDVVTLSGRSPRQPEDQARRHRQEDRRRQERQEQPDGWRGGGNSQRPPPIGSKASARRLRGARPAAGRARSRLRRVGARELFIRAPPAAPAEMSSPTFGGGVISRRRLRPRGTAQRRRRN